MIRRRTMRISFRILLFATFATTLIAQKSLFRSVHILGERAFRKQDYPTAFKWYKQAAEEGDRRAERDVGYMYEHGLGTDKDYAQAVFWYRKSAEHGDAQGQ